ncbi:MAG: ATP-binding cassette domain-containing protein [Geminicoccaceae bacterium]
MHESESGHLDASGLRIAFRTHGAPALDLDQLVLEPGARVALVGPSGSGKTTLAYALTGILAPDRGEVRWGEVILNQLSESRRDAWRRRHVGFVFQDFHLVPGLTPLENVLAPCYFTALRPTGEQVARARALLAQVEVPGARRDVTELSRGEQQRVAIARALLHDPPILVADEPTASLDAAHSARVIELLVGAAAERGRTLIAVSHDRDLIDRMGLVVRLEHGRRVD